MARQDLDPHSVLGVSPGASESEIKTAYRYLAKKFHPDVNPGDANAGTWFRKVEAAYSALKNKPAGSSSTGPSDAQLVALREEFARTLIRLTKQLSHLSDALPRATARRAAEAGDDYENEDHEGADYGPPTNPPVPARSNRRTPIFVLVGLMALVALVRILPSRGASASIASAMDSEWVSFQAGCRVRAEPDAESEKIGFARPGIAFAVLDKERGWRHIKLANGTLGWAGCRPSLGEP